MCYTSTVADVQFQTDPLPEMSDLVGLYQSVGWSLYSNDPERLTTAIERSDWVLTAWVNKELVGLARALTDGAFITYLQDVLVHPDHQRVGIGRALLARWLEDHSSVRQRVLMTDDEPKQLAFYQSLGLLRVGPGSELPCNVFYQDAAAEPPT